MTAVHQGILDCIGMTPFLPLRKIVPSDSARVLTTVESANPAGSMRDRMAPEMKEAAEADGRPTSRANV